MHINQFRAENLKLIKHIWLFQQNWKLDNQSLFGIIFHSKKIVAYRNQSVDLQLHTW